MILCLCINAPCITIDNVQAFSSLSALVWKWIFFMLSNSKLVLVRFKKEQASHWGQRSYVYLNFSSPTTKLLIKFNEFHLYWFIKLDDTASNQFLWKNVWFLFPVLQNNYLSLSHTHKNHLQIWLRVYINQIPLKILFWKITPYKLFYTLLSPAFRNKA